MSQMRMHRVLPTGWLGLLIGMALFGSLPLAAQVDSARAATWFAEAEADCTREAGRLWGMSLCGPIVVADAATRTVATNRPAPAATRPPLLGIVNAPLEWGGERWVAIAWPIVAGMSDERRRRVLIHELFHRIQPQLGLFITQSAATPDHLDTPAGRTWMQLEWRALSRALGSDGAAREATADALTFRAARHALSAGAAEAERVVEINEGLAQYTGTVSIHRDHAGAVADAIAQLAEAPANESFVGTAAYPIGAAYGLLLDRWSPGWTRQITSGDDLGKLLARAAGVTPTPDVEAAAARYGVAALRDAEERRERARLERLAELRRRFVDGPVLEIPRRGSASSITAGSVPLPGEGMIRARYRLTTDWGTLEADLVLVTTDQQTIRVPAPFRTEGEVLAGDGWTLTLAPGWAVRPGRRGGDYVLVAGDG